MPLPIGRSLRFAACLLAALALHAQSTVFIVRHAERTGEPDPPLNADGQRRAQALARLLSEAKVTRFFTSEALRAQQTAEPTAKRAGKSIVILKDKDIDGFVKRVRDGARPGEAALVVGHRSTVPLLVKAFGGGETTPLGSGEHDRLFVLTLLPGGKANVVTLRYGEESGR